MKYSVTETGDLNIVTNNSSAKMPNPSARRRSPMEGRLLFIVLALTVALVAMSGTLVILSGMKMQRLTTEVMISSESCESEECIISAARILKSIDRSVNPCTDFYQFACGGWLAKNPVPAEYAVWDQFRALREELLNDMKEILESPDTKMSPEPLIKARILYRTCLDEDLMETVGVSPLLKLMRSLGLPELPSPPESPSASVPSVPGAWLTAIARTQRTLASSYLFTLWVSEDLRNTSRNVMMLDQASPGFSERYLSNPERFAQEISDYKAFIIDMTNTLKIHIPGSKFNTTSFAGDILEFSTKLANIMTPAEERRDLNAQSDEMPIEQLQILTDGALNLTSPNPNKLDWLAYSREVFHGTNVTLDPATDFIIVMDSMYLKKLSYLLSITSQDTVERYVWWRVFSSLAPLTLRAFRNHAIQLGQRVMGHNGQTPRWRTCAASVNSNFGMALSYDYVQRNFQEHSRQKALSMVRDIQQAFENIVLELDWMDDKTKELTLQKSHAIRPFIGFPDWLLVPGELERYYEGVDVIDGQLLASYVGLSATSTKRTLEDLRRSPDRNKFVAFPTTVNAFYSTILNSITFPAGIMHPPFYGLGLEALNYGAIGAIMGHELTHGFDDLGRQYDPYGNLKQWWTNETLQEYNYRVQCIIDQYGRYNIEPLGANFTVNGITTQGENIADNGGLREAQKAYDWYRIRQRQLYQKNGAGSYFGREVEPRLPGLAHFSHDQLFYLGFAHMWCGNSTLGALKSTVIDGVHSPNRFRVIGTLSNMKEFSDAWGCPLGSPMNPANKCILW